MNDAPLVPGSGAESLATSDRVRRLASYREVSSPILGILASLVASGVLLVMTASITAAMSRPPPPPFPKVVYSKSKVVIPDERQLAIRLDPGLYDFAIHLKASSDQSVQIGFEQGSCPNRSEAEQHNFRCAICAAGESIVVVNPGEFGWSSDAEGGIEITMLAEVSGEEEAKRIRREVAKPLKALAELRPAEPGVSEARGETEARIDRFGVLAKELRVAVDVKSPCSRLPGADATRRDVLALVVASAGRLLDYAEGDGSQEDSLRVRAAAVALELAELDVRDNQTPDASLQARAAALRDRVAKAQAAAAPPPQRSAPAAASPAIRAKCYRCFMGPGDDAVGIEDWCDARVDGDEWQSFLGDGCNSQCANRKAFDTCVSRASAGG